MARPNGCATSSTTAPAPAAACRLPAVGLDGDTDTDFAAGGKSGLFLFENKTK